MSALPYLSPEQYLESEESSPVKREYLDGRVFAMAGATDEHGTIAVNLTTLIRGRLRGGPCRVYASDMKLHVPPANVFYYPDLFVTCDERDRGQRLAKRWPCLVIEILSTTTEDFDRGRKFAHYREIETLEEYVLVRQDRIELERYRRNDRGDWVLHSLGHGDLVTLESIDLQVPIEAIYEDVDFDNSGQKMRDEE